MIRRGILLDLLLKNKEEVVGDMIVAALVAVAVR